MGGGTIRDIQICLKGNMVRKLVYTFCCLIPVIKLALLDKDICKYLLYLLLSMKLAMAKMVDIARLTIDAD